MAGSTDGFWAITAVTAIPAAITSFVLERRRVEAPSTMPFTWGIYIGLSAVFIGIVLLVFAGLILFSDEASGTALLLALISAGYIASGYYAVRRYRAGLVASTILSFNIFWWIANAIYIRNRWGELRGIERTPRPTVARENPAKPHDSQTLPPHDFARIKSVQYAIDCPMCGRAQISDARTVWFLWGMILVARYGQRTFVGCGSCVRREALKSLVISGIAGWWCVPWGLGTPLVILQNLWETCRPTSHRTVEEILRKVGMNPDDIRLDTMGFTRMQRRLIDITAYVLNSVIWADGKVDPREHARALSILQQISAGRLTPEQAAARLASVREWDGKLNQLSFEIRQTLLSVALDVSTADGSISLPEMAILHQLAERLGFAPGTIEEMLNGSFSESSTRDGRARAGSLGEVSQAATVLGVRADASLMDIQSAWRRVILQYHPDRAAGDAALQRDFTHRSQKINWAKDVLTRHTSRMTAV